MWPIGDQCCWTGYGFWPLCPKRYIISCESVNRVLRRVLPARSIWTFFYLYSNYKKEMTITWICFCVRSVLFPKQGNRIKVVVPNSICILGIFCPQGLLPFPSSSGCNLIRFEYHSRSPPRCHWRNLTRNKQFLRLVRTSSWAFQRQWRIMDNVRRLFSLHQSVNRAVLIPEKKSPRNKFN